jgi:hypothetical protein
MQEIWKQIDGYEGYYEVSNAGIVRSVDRNIVRKDGSVCHRAGKDKALTPDKDGYLTVKLSKNGVDTRVAVHSLVAAAFVDGRFDGAEVNHKDFDRTNNNACNLEWVSHCDNVKYTIEAGRHVCNADLCGTNNPNYGNHSLSERYKNNPELSKEKQGRPGGKNGRARAVVLLDNAGFEQEFETIKDCANYIILTSGIESKTEWVSIKISNAIKANSKCYGFSVRYR